MSTLKTYSVTQDHDPEFSDIIRAETRAKAMSGYQQSWSGEWTALRAHRVPWLDGYDDPKGPDATMAMLRHGWFIPFEDTGDGLFDDSLANLDGMVRPSDLGQYAQDHHMSYEDVCKLYAKHIGATYPDKYKPTEEAA